MPSPTPEEIIIREWLKAYARIECIFSMTMAFIVGLTVYLMFGLR